MSLVEILAHDPDTDKPFKAKSFLEYLRLSSDHWLSQSGQVVPWVFRGHSSASWVLQPTAARPKLGKKLAEYDRLKARLSEEVPKVEHWGEEISAEAAEQIAFEWAHILAVCRFRDTAVELGLAETEFPFGKHQSLDKNGLEAWLKERVELHDPINDYRPMQYGYKPDYSRKTSIALAQHHGIPTFLLDWTASPIVSAFFALGEASSQDLAVWALRTDSLDLPDTEEAFQKLGLDKVNLVNTAREGNSFLSAQHGVFTTIENPYLNWTKNGAYPDLEKVFRSYESEEIVARLNSGKWLEEDGRGVHPIIYQRCLDFFHIGDVRLRKIVLPAGEREELQKLLKRENVTSAHLMPSLDNVRETILASLND